jgi:CheY-like chemotaxis protein
MPPSRADIVLIDDDVDIHSAIRLILEPEGYRLSTSPTGPEGLALVHRIRPPLVLLDVMLATPTEGFELAAKIRATPELAHTRIVMISAIDAAAGAEYALRMGSPFDPGDAFLTKPLRADVLRETVQRVLAAPESES